MDKEIDRIFRNSSKAELLERLAELLKTCDKAIVVLVEDKEDNKYTSQLLMLGLGHSYEALGILDVAKSDLLDNDY